MVGMLQIITYLLCVYLVFKGVEILQLSITGHAATGWKGILGRVIGVVAVVTSIAAASAFWRFIDAQAQSVANK